MLLCDMPAVSKQQQKFMGIVHAVQKGDMPTSKVTGDARDAAKSMSQQDVTDFASTRRKGLPSRAKRSSLDGVTVLQMARALMQ